MYAWSASTKKKLDTPSDKEFHLDAEALAYDDELRSHERIQVRPVRELEQQESCARR